MECFYFPNLTRQSKLITASGLDAKHLKANHIDKENVMLTDGLGLSAIACAERAGRNQYALQITDLLTNHGEAKPHIALGLGILGSRNRFEFALEKAVESGLNEFFPLITAHAQKDTTNRGRLLAKSIAAMIQCKRSCLPAISPPLNLEMLLSKASEYDRIILADPDGEIPGRLDINGRYLILTGPEGGFSGDERMLMNEIDNLLKWRFGRTRLRAETAATLAVGIVSSLA